MDTANKLLETLLGLPDIEVKAVEVREQDIRITVQSTQPYTHCRLCGQKIEQFYGHDREVLLRHLPILGKPTFLCIFPARYRCLSCAGEPTTTQQLEWYSPRSRYTKAYEQHLLLSLVNSTVEDVSLKEDVGYEALMGIVDRYVGKVVEWTIFTSLLILGIDEISLKKGHRDFVVIISARLGDRVVVLGVLEDRKKETVKRFLLSIPKRLRKTVEVVCSDLYEGFAGAVKEVFGRRVKVIADRFHVAKLYRQGMEKLRKQEMKRLKKALPDSEYKQLRGVMWALRKKPTDLNDKERAALVLLFKYSPLLQQAYEKERALTGIFDDPITKRQAQARIRKWKAQVLASGLSCFDPFLKTLEKWMDAITNYFTDRLSSGFVEGLNNKIKVIKRRCYGIFNIQHLFQRIELDLNGYQKYGIQS